MSFFQTALTIVEANRGRTIAVGAAVIGAIALVDWRIVHNVSLGYLYVIPVVILATALDSWQIALIAVSCAILRESFSPFAFQPDYLTRIVTVSAAMTGAGLLTREVSLNRRLLARQIELERRHAEEQRASAEHLSVLVETSPLAVVIAGGNGRLLLANQSAREMLGLDPDYKNEEIGRYLPALAPSATAPYAARGLRTQVECRAKRRNGEVFLAQVWFSVWSGGADSRLQAVIWDASEDLAGKQLGAVNSLMATSRVVAGALGHEVRNLAGAARKLYEAAARDQTIANGDFSAMGEILRLLERLGSSQLVQSGACAQSAVDLGRVLYEARVTIEQLLSGSDVALEWDAPENLPRVCADSAALMQVFLNLVNNSCEAMRAVSPARICVAAALAGDMVAIRFRDTGPGVADPERLFRPFSSSGQGAGLGLYISRAIVRSFGGDLYFEPRSPGASFVVELPAEVSSAA